MLTVMMGSVAQGEVASGPADLSAAEILAQPSSGTEDSHSICDAYTCLSVEATGWASCFAQPGGIVSCSSGIVSLSGVVYPASPAVVMGGGDFAAANSMQYILSGCNEPPCGGGFLETSGGHECSWVYPAIPRCGASFTGGVLTATATLPPGRCLHVSQQLSMAAWSFVGPGNLMPAHQTQLFTQFGATDSVNHAQVCA
jgi:hypothetical protein